MTHEEFMQDTPLTTPAARANLPVIMIAAVVQGLALYGLHYAQQHKTWPTTDTPWLVALYSIAILIPTTVQLFAEYLRTVAGWLIVAAMTVAFGYFGLYQGSIAIDGDPRYLPAAGPFACTLFVLWLMLLPFAQHKLQTGSWRPRYQLLFTLAWRNHLLLAEAGVFTLLFWLLLFLWGGLFDMLNIDFFKTLFSDPLFAYPATAIAFGIALHLIGSVERWVAIVLEQGLNIFKWLAVVAGLILTLFSVALVSRLPTAVFTGQHAIAASWLLWLVAAVVLFLNAAYRDGSIAQPYPSLLGRALKWTVPLTIVCSATALYALTVRVREYGLTVDRIWALVVAGSAMIYSVGYSASAFSRRWLPSMAPVNIFVALALIATIVAMQTPLLSPARLSANSQYRMALNGDLKAERTDKYRGNLDPFEYLQFEAGRYGRERLAELAKLQDHPRAEAIRTKALAVQQQQNRWGRGIGPKMLTAENIRDLPVFPPGRVLAPALVEALRADIANPKDAFSRGTAFDEYAGLFVDLDGDGIEEFVLQTSWFGRVYQNSNGKWSMVAKTSTKSGCGNQECFKDAVAAGKVSAVVPAWKDLVIGGITFGVGNK